MQCLQKDPEKCKFKYSRKLSSVETNQNIKRIFLEKKKKKKKKVFVTMLRTFFVATSDA